MTRINYKDVLKIGAIITIAVIIVIIAIMNDVR
jgi:di/tricarboxylate transporter